MNNGKKFDICLMNPPYGSPSIGNVYLHLDITTKILNICNHTIDFMNNKLNNKINIYYKNNTKESVNTLYDVSTLTPYEKSIVHYLYATNINYHPGGLNKSQKINLEEYYKKWVKQFPNNSVFLVASSANGSMNARFFSKRNGNIYDSKNELIKYLIDTNAAVCNVMLFNSHIAAENCKIALTHPLLRFGLSKLLDDLHMSGRCYKYVPDINWKDERVKTDEGLLEVCGCPKDKCKEYAEYCKNYINNNYN